MVAFSIYTFDSADNARRVLAVVEALHDAAAVAVDDVAVMVWSEGALRPTAWQERSLGGARALSGAFWGLLFAVLFLLPLTGVEIGSDRCRGLLAAVGLDDTFLREITALLGPGRSALFLLADARPVPRLETALARRNAHRLHHYLDEDHLTVLRLAFLDDQQMTLWAPAPSHARPGGRPQ